MSATKQNNAGGGRRLMEFAARFLRDDCGDDLIEYALLTTTVGCVGVAAYSFVSSAIASAYQSWTYGQQNLWIPPNP